ncbi:MAG: hypothetical protein RLZ57_110 [Actinomycetota bacterium]|jgi:integrase/recombinase XerD
MSFSAGFLDYLAIEKGAAKNTIVAYRRDLNRYEQWLESRNVDLSRIDENIIREYSRFLSELKLKPSSIERNFSAIRSLHKYLSKEFNQLDPTDALPETKQSKRLPKALTVSEIQSIIDTAKQPNNPITLRDSLILELLYGTGARVSEIVNISISDINLIKVDGEEITTIKLQGKGGKERIVPIGNFAKQALDDYLIRTRPALNRSGKNSALLLNNRGGKLSRQSAWQVVKTATKLANIKLKVTPHVFRHSYATHLLDGGADIRVVQELLGHASVTTTQIYTLITVDKLRESYRLAHPRAN